MRSKQSFLESCAAVLVALSLGASAALPGTSSVELDVNATTLQTSGDWVTVSWSGVRSPTIHDAVALVVPADVDPKLTAPVKHKWCTASPSHLTNGSGTLEFRLLNVRADMRFILVTDLVDWLGKFTLLAQSPIISPANPNEPLQGHLARTQDPSQMLVQWTTRDRGDSPVVVYGTHPGAYGSAAPANSSTYGREDLCGGVANSTGFLDPGFFHTAVMTDLEPDTTYFYSYGEEGYAFSPEYSFKTAPGPGSDVSVSLLAIADLGFCESDGAMTWSGNYRNPIEVTPPGTDDEVRVEVQNALHMGWAEYCAALVTVARMGDDMDGRTLVVHNGDVSYAEGFGYGWEIFMDMMVPLIRRAPYMLSPGNHERDWPGTGTRFDFPPARDSGGECGVPYARRFPMPQPGPDLGPDFMWYSFDHGPIHFLQLSTEHDFAPGSAQFAFLLADLRAVNRSATPWLVVGFHRPFYTDSVYGNSDTGDVGFTDDIRNALERLFFQFQVDMTLFGHVHSYSRTCPVFQRNCVPARPDGSAGAPVHVLIGHAGAPFSWTINDVTPPYYEAVAVEHGYMRATANRTAMHMQVVSSASGDLMDDFVLSKAVDWKPDQAGQLHTLALFHSTYTPTWLELSGINGPAEGLILKPAASLLLSDSDLLDELRNATLVQNPTGLDTIAAMNQILQPLDEIFRTRLANAKGTSEDARFFYDHYFSHLFKLYQMHADGRIKGTAEGVARAGPVRVPVMQGPPV